MLKHKKQSIAITKKRVTFRDSDMDNAALITPHSAANLQEEYNNVPFVQTQPNKDNFFNKKSILF